MRTSVRTLPPPDFSRQQPSVAPPPVISLVRTGPRSINEYVDTPCSRPSVPLKNLSLVNDRGRIVDSGPSPGSAHRILPPVSPRQSGRTSCPSSYNDSSNNNNGGSHGSPRPNLTHTTPHGSSSSTPIISTQPPSKSPPIKEVLSLLDEPQGRGTAEGSSTRSHTGGDGIICDQCGKCQCKAHSEPRPLPSHWCCGDACELSPDTIIDCCTCFCCVKCTFYHFGGPEEENDCYDNPCGCMDTSHCCKRWTVLTAMAMCLPCLWAYWPAKGCLAMCTCCYNACRPKGCQCHLNKQKTPGLSSVSGVGGSSGNGIGSSGGSGTVGLGGGSSKHSQTRRLLIESDSSSA